MLKKYKHISFDLDGTLVHTTPEYRYALVSKIVEALGGTLSDPRLVDRFWFESGREAFIRNTFKLDPDVFWSLFHIEDAPELRSVHTKAYHDAERAVRKLKDMGKVVSVITGSPQGTAEMELEKLNGAPHDYLLSTSSAGHSPKPDPAALQFVLAELDARPEETVYVGNGNEDALFARNAGVDFIYLERKEYEFDLRDYSLAVVQSLNELFESKQVRPLL